MLRGQISNGLSSIRFGKESNWFVSHVGENSGLFYLQQNDPSISVKYERQMQEIERAASQGGLENFDTPPSVGLPCIGKYSVDSQWYRGLILNVYEDEESAEVLFIDYGNEEVLSWKNLRKANKEFTELPAQALQSKLAHIDPAGGTWSKEALKLLKEMVGERELIGTPTHLCRTGAVVVNLYADEEKSVMVGEQLVMAGFAHWKKVKSHVSQSTASSSGSASSESLVNSSSGQLAAIKIKAGSYFDLCISFIESVDSFYCQPVQQSKDLNDLIDDMQKFYNSSRANELKVNNLKVEQVCCAKYSEDAIWYRGIVISIHPNQIYDIQFVDFGNREKLPLSDIRELSQCFKQLPIFGLHCCLYGTIPGNRKSSFDDEAITKFEELTSDKQLAGFVNKVEDSGRLALVLFDTSNSKDGVNIGKELSKLGTVECVNDIGTTIVKCESSQSAPVTMTPHFVPMQLNAGDIEMGFVAFSTCPTDFMCQLSKNVQSLQNMMRELNEEYSRLKPGEKILQTDKLGTPCCARYSEDGQFYRAELINVTNPNAMIHFVDYGNREQCRLDELKQLRKEYMKLPKQAIPCKLSGIELPPNGFPVDVCAQFNDMVMDKEFNMTFVDVDLQGVSEAALVEKNDRNVMTFDVARTLIESGMASEQKIPTNGALGRVATATMQYSNIQLPEEDYLDVMVTHVTNPNEFCCQLLENSDKIDELMADLEHNYHSSKQSRNMTLKNGMPCVALYSEDGYWYRALILRFYGSNADVSYVDFGNTENVSVDGVRPIHEKFMKLPAQAFVCSLAGVIPKPGGDWSKDAIEKFSALVLEKQLIASFRFKDESNLHHIELVDTQTNLNKHKNTSEILLESGLAERRSSQSDASTASIGSSSHRSSAQTQEPRVLNETPKQSPVPQGNMFSDVKLKPGDQETAYVVQVDDLENIYCQLKRHEDSLYELSDKINNEAVACPPVTSLTKGKPVCALYSVDDAWYRGEIVMVAADKNAAVRFVDYGNMETMQASSMREIPPSLLSHPKYGIACSLIDNGTKWKDGAAEKLVQMTADKPLKVAVKELKNGKYVIDIYDEDNSSIAPKLLAPIESHSKNEESTAQEQKQLNKAVPTADVIVGTQMDCYVSFVESLRDFYVQPFSVVEDLDFVTERMAEAESFPALDQPKKGDLCCAKFEDDGMWYRARIVAINGDEIETWFLDYGNSGLVRTENIKSTPDTLRGLPPLSIPCALDGVTSQSDEDIDLFVKGTMDQVASVEFLRKNSDGRYETGLKVDGVPMAFDKGERGRRLELTTSEAASSEENKTRDGSSIVQSPAVIVTFNEKTLLIDSTHEAFVSYAVTAQEFYCHLEADSSKLESIMDKLEIYYGNQPPGKDSLISIASGVSCAAKYSVDGGWYRAEIESVEGPSEVKVRFVDYGNVETVDIEDVKILKDDLLEDAAFAVKCSLIGDVGSGVDFETRVMDKKFDLTVTGLNGSTHLVDLIDEGKLLSKELSKKVSGLENEEKKVQAYKIAEVKEGTTIDVYYLDGKSPHEFYCHLVKYENEFIELMKNIADSKNTFKSFLKPEVNAACVGMFSEDGAWYRGKIVAVDGMKSKVVFVDYGNEEWVKNENIKEIPEEFLVLPLQAVSFSLDDVFPAGESWSKADTVLLEEICDGKMLSANLKSYENGKVSAVLKDSATGEVVNNAFKRSINEADVSRQKDNGSLRYRYAGITEGMKIQAYCTFVKESGEICCQMIEYQHELNELMHDVGLYCDGKAKLVSNCATDAACLALYEEDDSWYRAKVIRSDDGDKATVRFVDYGNESVCAMAHLRDARAKDLELPVTCFDCKLQGLNVSNDVTAIVEKLCIDQELIVYVKDVVSNELVIADVSLAKSKESIPSIVGKQIPVSKEKVTQTQSMTFSKLNLPVGASENVVCTTVESIDEVSFRVSKHENEFNEMMDNIAKNCETNQNVLEDAIEGQCCLAKYSADGEWYRAEVTSLSTDKIKVKYVDYGNLDTVSYSDTRKMVDDYLYLPAMCVSCKLYDVYKEDLDAAKGREWLEQSCIDKEYKIVIVENNDGIIKVNAYHPGSNDTVNDDLYAQFELGKSLVGMQPIASSVEEKQSLSIGEKSDTQIADDNSAAPQADAPQADAPEGHEEAQFISVPISGKLPAVCSYVDDALQVYCQPSRYSTDLDQLMADIADYCAEVSNGIGSVNVGSPCFAMFADDCEWYRAEIVDIDDDVIEVVFVDFGNRGHVKKSQILPITKPFLKLPKAVFACTISGMAKWSQMRDLIKAWIEEQLVGEQLEVEIIEESSADTYMTKLYFEGKDIQNLIEEVCTISADVDLNRISENNANETMTNGGSSETSHVGSRRGTKFTHKNLTCPLNNEGAICTQVDSLHEVFCQLTKYQVDFDEMSDKMQTRCNENRARPETFDAGSSCFAKCSVDEQWYRADIIESLDEGHVKMRFVDYGHTDVVLRENTRVLDEELAKLPITTIKCRLLDVHEEDLRVKEAVQWLLDNVVDQELIVNVVEVVDGSYHCILTKRGDDVTVNDQLYYLFELATEEQEPSESNQNATAVDLGPPRECKSAENEDTSKDIEAKSEPGEKQEKETAECIEVFSGTISQQTPKLGTRETVFCTLVESIYGIAVQLLQSLDKFDEISEKVTIYCGKESKLPNAFTEGSACLAKAVDEHWYRAEIIGVNRENVDVYFVDYGNTETVSKQDTRAMTKEFASLPALAINCQLHDVHDYDIDVDMATQWLCENVLETEISVEIIGKVDESYDVILTRKDDDVSINDLLYEKFELQEEPDAALEHLAARNVVTKESNAMAEESNAAT